MARRQKPGKGKAEPPLARKSPKSEGPKVRDLEKRLAEAQEQQAATAEILQVIRRSSADTQPVFDLIVDTAARLLRTDGGILTRVIGDRIELAAFTSSGPAADEGLRAGFPVSVDVPGSMQAITIRNRAPFVSADFATDHRLNEGTRHRLGARGFRSGVSVPLLDQGVAIGAISVTRRDPVMFTSEDIALLQTFADQAVIAIENVRMFTELQEKNRALTEAYGQVTETLERQTATSEILRVISSSLTDVNPVFRTILANANRLCDASFSVLWLWDGEAPTAVAHENVSPAMAEALRTARPLPNRRSPLGLSVLEQAVVHVADVLTDRRFTPEDVPSYRLEGARSILCVPMVREGSLVGLINIWRREPRAFTDGQIALVRTFADQAVIAIENVRLFKELEARNRDLTATSEILGVISGSPTDVQPVFDTIARSAAQLCHAHTAAVFLTDGEFVHHPASHGDAPDALAAIRTRFPRRLDRDTAAGTAILTRSVIHVPDIEEPSVVEFARQTGRAVGFRSLLSVPMLRQGDAVGAINVTRREPGVFSDAEVALLQTFADQAVIAIENVRLFKELQAANRELAAASQHKSEFLANMSHELRTPLNAIIGFSEVLSEKMFGELNEKQEEYSKDIHASGQHLLSLINDILDLSKIEAGRMELELTDFDLPTAIDNALMLVRERAGRRSLTLHKAVDGGLGQIRADERKIRQVVLNLLSNAIKFTPEGGRIEVGAALKDGFAEVAVRDTGIGIALEDQERVFEEFRQAGTAAKKVEGTGLGLTLCRKFVELHGGRIWVKSQVGAGSTFTFTIPVRHGE